MQGHSLSFFWDLKDFNIKSQKNRANDLTSRCNCLISDFPRCKVVSNRTHGDKMTEERHYMGTYISVHSF